MKSYISNFNYELRDKKIVYQGKRIKVEERNYWSPGLQKNIYREHVLSADSVAILAITEDQKILLVEEPRTPIEQVGIGFPAGLIEEKEEPVIAAKRELEEETGYLAGNLKKIREFYPTIGFSNEKTTIFLATQLQKTKQKLDEMEEIKVHAIAMDEVKEMLKKNIFKTPSVTIGLMDYFLYHEGKEETKKGEE